MGNDPIVAPQDRQGLSPQHAGVVDLDLEVQAGELLVLIGPSGCGKSTLLRMIAGLEMPTAGEISLDGRRVNDDPPHVRNVGMLFQDEALQPHLDVRGNLAFGLRLRRGLLYRSSWLGRRGNNSDKANHETLTNGEITQRINKAVVALGIEHLLARLPRQLSGGERQRVALGQAMVRSPKLMLLDEPLASLDAPLRAEMRAEIKKLQQRLGVTTIYVTHDQVEAMTLGDRIAVMVDGRLEQIGPPCEVYDRPTNQRVAGLLGSPAMNFITGRIERRDGKSQFVGGGLQVELSAEQAARFDRDIKQPVVLGIRPEHIHVSHANVKVDSPGTDVASLANITMVETLGDSAILHLRMGNAETTELRSKYHGRWTGAIGTDIAMRISSKDCQFFDANNGQNITV